MRRNTALLLSLCALTKPTSVWAQKRIITDKEADAILKKKFITDAEMEELERKEAAEQKTLVQKSGPIGFKNTIDCTLTTGATLSVPVTDNKDEGFKAKTVNDNMKITITNLDSKEPLLVGNAGTEKLGKTESGNKTYLIEITPGGNLNVWTYYPESNFITLSKQYGRTSPYAVIYGGKCQIR